MTQCTWRKIQEFGHTQKYKESESFRLFCGKIDSLAFLPIGFIPAGMQHLKETCPAEARRLLAYFDQTYVSGTIKRRLNGNQIQIPPRFPPKWWNVNKRTLNSDPRTNNHCEGWNFKFFKLVGMKHPSIWKLIRALQQEDALARIKIQKINAGIDIKPRTKKIYVDLQKRLLNICKRFDQNELLLEDFITMIGRTIRFGDD